MDAGSVGEGMKPRLAATLVLVRRSVAGPEVLITIRQKNLRFMPGAAVFPGGAVDEGDLDPRWSGLTDLPTEAIALGHFVAAVRETYEEVVLLLADPKGAVIERS